MTQTTAKLLTGAGQGMKVTPKVPLKKALMELIVRHGKVKAVGIKKPVSNRTQDWREQCLFLMFKQLKELGYRLERPEQLRETHVKALVAKWEKEELSPSTIQNRLSVARMFASWIGKGGMIRGSEEYVEDPNAVKRSTATTTDKSWSSQGIDKEALFTMVSAYDRWVGMQLRLMDAFALRREEAVMFKPHRADHGHYIIVRDGTKGGRERSVGIDHDWQRAILDQAKTMATRVNSHIGHPDHSLKQALRRFNYVMERFGITRAGLGITSHGLRHERLNDMFEEITGVPSPVRSLNTGTAAPSIADVDPHLVDLARARVSEAAGHNRLSISNAYTGSPAAAKKAALNWTIPAGHQVSDHVAPWARLAELGAKPGRTQEEDAEFSMLKSQLGLAAPAQE